MPEVRLSRVVMWSKVLLSGLNGLTRVLPPRSTSLALPSLWIRVHSAVDPLNRGFEPPNLWSWSPYGDVLHMDNYTELLYLSCVQVLSCSSNDCHQVGATSALSNARVATVPASLCLCFHLCARVYASSLTLIRTPDYQMLVCVLSPTWMPHINFSASRRCWAFWFTYSGYENVTVSNPSSSRRSM